MSGTKDDSRCQKAVHIVSGLCRKKSLPSLDLDACREFLLLPSDQSLSITEPGTVLWSCVLEQCLWLQTARGRRTIAKGRKCLQAHCWNLGGNGLSTHICVIIFLYMFLIWAFGASTTYPVDVNKCNLVGIAVLRRQTGEVLVERWLMI